MQLGDPSYEQPTVNPQVLHWARNYSGFSLDSAAKRLKVNIEQLVEWEDPRSGILPTLGTAREMAKLYERPFLEFFLYEVPDLETTSSVPDFRARGGAVDEEEARTLLKLRRWGETQRLNLLDLAEILEIEIPKVPASLYANDLNDVERIAGRARELLGPSTHQQMSLTKSGRDQFPSILRDSLMQHGIFVLYRSELIKTKTRGMCLFTPDLPTIIYTNESPSAQAFTIAHELGHVVSKQRAISGTFTVKQPKSWKHKETEQWCDRFAAAFLVPAEEINEFLVKPDHPKRHIDDSKLDMLAKKFAVSAHAMLIRLIELRYVHQDFYWQNRRPELIRQESEYKAPPAQPKFYGSRFQKRVGKFYTGLVLEAWDSDMITVDDAQGFLGIEKFQHFEDIQRHFSP